jgi:exocyst complex component 5
MATPDGNPIRTGSGKALFPTGPSFTLENFSNKDFIVRDFVEELSESASPARRRSGPAHQAFDPKPLIRTFESNGSYFISRLLLANFTKML